MLLTGATGGIGQAIARALDERGARLQLTARRTEQLEQIAAGLNGQAEVLPADLTDASGAAALAERAGKVDVLVANAGLPASGPIDDFSAEQIDRALDVNLRAPIQLTRALLPGMLERGSGHVVLMSSLSGKIGVGRLLALLGHQVRPAGLRLRSARGPARHRGGRDRRVPGLRLRRRHARRLGRSAAALGRHAHARRGGGRGGRAGSSRAEPRSTWPRSACAPGALAGSLAPATFARLQRHLGSARLSDAIAAGQRPKR